jgi:hypothetical protein
MRYLVRTPVPGYTGPVVGVHFVDGEAVVEDTKLAAMQFFDRHGYHVEQIDGDKDLEEAAQGVQEAQQDATEPGATGDRITGPGAAEGDLRLGEGRAQKVADAAEAAQGQPYAWEGAGADPADGFQRPADNAPKKEWAAYAAHRLDMSDADANAKTKAELVALVDEHDKKENDQ